MYIYLCIYIYIFNTYIYIYIYIFNIYIVDMRSAWTKTCFIPLKPQSAIHQNQLGAKLVT